jgi:hypothetical protein
VRREHEQVAGLEQLGHIVPLAEEHHAGRTPCSLADTSIATQLAL